MEISFHSVIPVLRIFNIAKADEFYLGFLGFKVDWDHRFDPIAPLYRQISRGNLILHLSEQVTPPLGLSDRVPSGCLAEQFATLRTDPRCSGVKACPWFEQGALRNTSAAKRQAAKLR